MEASLRLKNELSNFSRNRAYGTYARPSESNLFLWNCQIYYKGYFLKFNMKFLSTYPITPPVVYFTNSLFHPNVYENGRVCLDILNENWSPSISVRDVLKGLMQLLEYPNINSPANSEAAKLYKKKNKTDYYFKEDTYLYKFYKYYEVFKK